MSTQIWQQCPTPSLDEYLTSEPALPDVTRDSRARSRVLLQVAKTTDEQPYRVVYQCDHGGVLVRVAPDDEHRLTPYTIRRIAAVAQLYQFGCDCMRPLWKAVFGTTLTRKTLEERRRWLKRTIGPESGFHAEAVWYEAIGPRPGPWDAIDPKAAEHQFDQQQLLHEFNAA